MADVAGAWIDPPDATTSDLIERCKRHWHVPVDQLSDLMVATYLNQRIATALVLAEARRRLAAGVCDDSELYAGQLAEAVKIVETWPKG